MRPNLASRLSAGLFVGFFAAVPAASTSELEPYQMVRSLQLVQDKLATGDHGALPMQRKLLEMIDERLRDAPAEEFEDKRNLRAVLVYGVSGGNPRTVEIVLSRLGITSSDPVASGVLGYLQGRTEAALTSLSAIDPMAQEFELGAFLALVKGSVVAGQDPQAGMAFLDQARLLAPGTLIEESALRRSVALAAALNDAERFLRASGQYIRRFLHSPYAGQFADAFVAGAVTLDSSIGSQRLAKIVSQMTRDHQEVVYLRLARRGMIGGLTELSAFAAAKATELGVEDASDDPRADLYSSISSVTSETVEQIAGKLKSIDRAQLSSGDLRLLAAAEAIAAEVLAEPAAAETLAPDREAAPEAEALTATADPGVEQEPIRLIVDETRKKLEEIDQLLGANGG